MQSGFIIRSSGTIILFGFVVMVLLFSGCTTGPDSQGFAEPALQRLCEKFEAHETLVQKFRQKRMEIADDFGRESRQKRMEIADDFGYERTMAQSRVSTN